MHAHLIGSYFGRAFLAGALGLTVALSAFAIDAEPEVALRVKVLPDHYAVGGARFSDVAALEAWVRPTGARVLQLDSCGQDSTKQLLAAVERLHHVYARGLEIRTLAAGEPGCPEAIAEPTIWARDAVGQLPAASEYDARDAHGRGVMP